LVDQFLTERDAVGIVHCEDLDRRSSHRGFADEHRSFPPEVLRPAMPSWVEQSSELFRPWIDSSEVRPLVEVASQAGEGEVAEGCSTSVLLCNNVLDLKRREVMGFREAAVFAATSGPPPNMLLYGFRHP